MLDHLRTPPLPRPRLAPLNPVQALSTRLHKPFSPSQMQDGQSAMTSTIVSARDLIASSNTSVISPNVVEITLASSVLNQLDSSFMPPLLSPPQSPYYHCYPYCCPSYHLCSVSLPLLSLTSLKN